MPHCVAVQRRSWGRYFAALKKLQKQCPKQFWLFHAEISRNVSTWVSQSLITVTSVENPQFVELPPQRIVGEVGSAEGLVRGIGSRVFTGWSFLSVSFEWSSTCVHSHSSSIFSLFCSIYTIPWRSQVSLVLHSNLRIYRISIDLVSAFQCGRFAVYVIIFQQSLRSSWNYYYLFIYWIERWDRQCEMHIGWTQMDGQVTPRMGWGTW